MPNTVRKIDGLLPHSNLHTVRVDRHHFVGEFLAEQKRHSRSGTAGRDHRADDDHLDVLYQCRATQNLVHKIDRRLLGNLFRNGLRFVIRCATTTTHTNGSCA